MKQLRKNDIKSIFINKVVIVTILFIVMLGAQLGASPIFEEDEEAVSGQQIRERTQVVTLGEIPSVRGVAEQVLPVVVEVNVVEVITQNLPRQFSPWDFFFGPGPEDEGEQQQREFRRPGLGSGVIVRQDGKDVYVLTNHHVVGEADQISVRLYDEREFKASIVGSDPRTDLALIKFESKESVPIAVMGDSDDLYVGDFVIAVGNPYGFESTVTFGIVSALGRRPEPGTSVAGFTDYIQTDAAINPGNSGGALVDMKGQVVGINSWIASRSGGSVGIGFAIPINIATKAIDDFIRTGKVEYGWLGVGIGDLDEQRYPGVKESLGVEDKDGVFVINVYQGSPADQSGLLPGDYITSVGGEPVEDSYELTQIVGNMKTGEQADFSLIRYGEQKTVSVRLGSRPTEETLAKATNLWPGMSVITITEEIEDQLDLPRDVDGVVVAGVTPNAGPAMSGFKPGDIITEVSKEDVSGLVEFYKAINEAPEGELLFKIYRQGNVLLVGLMKP